jgi:hypothetical protein
MQRIQIERSSRRRARELEIDPAEPFASVGHATDRARDLARRIEDVRDELERLLELRETEGGDS